MAVDPEKVYHGKPCKKCGETLRWRSNRGCVACDRERKRAPKYRARAREWKRKGKRTLANAGLCTTCGQPKLSEWYCWDCLSKKQTYKVTKQVNQVAEEIKHGISK